MDLLCDNNLLDQNSETLYQFEEGQRAHTIKFMPNPIKLQNNLNSKNNSRDFQKNTINTNINKEIFYVLLVGHIFNAVLALTKGKWTTVVAGNRHHDPFLFLVERCVFKNFVAHFFFLLVFIKSEMTLALIAVYDLFN